MQLLTSLVHDSHWRPAWRTVLLALVCVAAWFAFTPTSASSQPSDIDKVEHFVAFAALGLAGSFTTRAGLSRSAWIGAGLLLYGAFIELVQTQLPTRQASWADLLADGVGVAAGLALATLLRSILRR